MINRIPDERLLAALLETAEDAIVFADSGGVILYANSIAHRAFGYEHGELDGISVGALVPESIVSDHAGKVRWHLNTAEKHAIGPGRRLEGMRKDGTRFPLQLSVGQGRSEDEDFLVGIMHDLSGRQRVERALERSQRMEALGELTGGIAHDFNNILTVITGNLELLKMEEAHDYDSGILEDALEAAELGVALTAQLLVFARRGVLMPEDVDVNEIASGMAGLLQRTLGPRISLITGFEKRPWIVQADPTQLQTALINLAVNAKAAMPNGGALIIETANMVIDDTYIAQELDVREGEYVRISVSDNGIGMSELVRRRAFEPFFTTKPPGQGTGLGLSMLYGFARQSGGHATIYSEEGQGTTVNIYLPRSKQEPVDVGVDQIAGTAELPRGDGQIVLVVEDNPAVRRLSVKRVQALGYRTMRTDNADKALEILQTTPEIAVLFTDIVMPGSMTGYELALKARKTFPGVRVLLTTAYAGKLLDSNGSPQSGFLLLRKPFRQEDLAEKLNALLES